MASKINAYSVSVLFIMQRRRNDSDLYVAFPPVLVYRCGFLALNDSEAFTSDGGSWRQGKREESASRLTFDPVNRSPPSLINYLPKYRLSLALSYAKSDRWSQASQLSSFPCGHGCGESSLIDSISSISCIGSGSTGNGITH